MQEPPNSCTRYLCAEEACLPFMHVFYLYILSCFGFLTWVIIVASQSLEVLGGQMLLGLAVVNIAMMPFSYIEFRTRTQFNKPASKFGVMTFLVFIADMIILGGMAFNNFIANTPSTQFVATFWFWLCATWYGVLNILFTRFGSSTT